MSGRPPKTLIELVRDGTFRSRRHHELLAGIDLPWPAFNVLQQGYRAAASGPERRAIGLEFERAVRLVQEQAAREATAGTGRSLAGELAELGPAGSVKQLLAFFPAYLTHPKGPKRGEPFELEPWQRRFLRELYRRDKQGRRVYRRALLAMPRGNGKTQIAAGLALYELVRRSDAPEIYLAAASKDQAAIGLSFARSFVEEGPLADWVKGRRTVLTCPASSGRLQVISSEGSLQHGLAPAVAIIDELWAFQHTGQREAYKALSTALHKRDDSYLLGISTAGYDRQSLLYRIYEQALDWPEIEVSNQGCLTICRDPENGLLLWWYGAPSDADTTSRAIVRACNPASFVKQRDLEQQRHDPGLSEADYKRLHLNQWVSAEKVWLPDGSWEALTSKEKIPSGAKVYLGVDVGLTQDTTALAWAHVLPDGRIIVRARVWAGHEKAAAHEHVTEGKVQLATIEQFILERLADKFSIQEVAYDPRFFHRSAEILELRNLTTVEVLQTSAPMYDACQRFYQLAASGQLTHNGDKVLAAHIAATAARPTERGWKLSKLRSHRHIDATIACVLAVARADLHNAPKPTPRIDWMPL